MNLKDELLETLNKIDKNLDRPTSDEEVAMLLIARANILIALQKYEVGGVI